MVGPPTLAMSSRKELLAAVLDKLAAWFLRRVGVPEGELQANHVSAKGRITEECYVCMEKISNNMIKVSAHGHGVREM
jgi:hypothetical protein